MAQIIAGGTKPDSGGNVEVITQTQTTTWAQLQGKPYIAVSSKGIYNGLSTIPNDGADFGPDTTLGATAPGQYGSPYTETCGIVEAINSSPTVYNAFTKRNVPMANIKLLEGIFNITKAIYTYDDWFVTIEGNMPSGGGILGTAQENEIQSASPQGAFITYRTPSTAIPSNFTGAGILYLRGAIKIIQTVQITDSPINSVYVFTTFDRTNVTDPYTSSESGGSDLGGLFIDNLSVVDQSGLNGVVEISGDGGQCTINFLNVSGSANVNARSLLSLGWNNFSANMLSIDGLNPTLPSVASGEYIGIGLDYYRLGSSNAINVIHFYGYMNAVLRWAIGYGFISQIFFELQGLPASGQYGIDGQYVIHVASSLIVSSVNFNSISAGSGGTSGLMTLPIDNIYGFIMQSISDLNTDPSSGGATGIWYPLALNFGPSTGLVSGTTYYYQQGPPVMMYIPVTFNPTSTASATFSIAVSGAGVTSSIPETVIPAGAVTGMTIIVPVRLQAGWAVIPNYTNCTLGQAIFING